MEHKEWFSWAWKLSSIALCTLLSESLGYWFLLESSYAVCLQGLSTGREVCKEPYFSCGKNSYRRKCSGTCRQVSPEVLWSEWENISEMLYLSSFNFTVLCGECCLRERQLNELPETFRKSIFVLSQVIQFSSDKRTHMCESSHLGCHCQSISNSTEMVKNRKKNLCKPVHTQLPIVYTEDAGMEFLIPLVM